MLDDAAVLSYIKRNLGFPFMALELSDKEILDYIKDITIRDWSYYVPNVNKMNLNLSLEANRVAGKTNEFYLNEPDGREILGVKDLYFDQGNLMALGHPPFGVFNEFELREWAYQVNSAMTAKMFSSWDKTFEFQHPNIVRISPYPFNNLQNVTVEYERMSSTDFSEIPNDVHRYFLDLALADIMIALGRIRKRYENIKTPFGDIPISDQIFDEGKTLRGEIIEKLERLFVPNVRVCHG